MSFSAVGTEVHGSVTSGTTVTASINPTGVGNYFFLIALGSASGSGVAPTSVSGGNCVWTQIGTNFTNSTHHVPTGATFNGWLGTAIATGSSTVTVTFASSVGIGQLVTQQFTATGIPTLDVQGGLDVGSGSTMPSLTPAASGEMYIGYDFDSGTASAGTTSGYTYQIDSSGNGLVYDMSCGSGAQAPTFNDNGVVAGIAFMLTTTSGVREDSSTPAVTNPANSTNVTSGVATSNSFTPPSGTFVIVPVSWLFQNNTTGTTLTCKDSNSVSYTLLGTQELDGNKATANAIFGHYYASSPGSITVSVTSTDTGTAGALIAPRVLDGASSTQPGGTNVHAATGSNWTGSVTTTIVGSLVYIVAGATSNETVTANTNIGLITTDSNTTQGDTGAIGKALLNTSSPASTNFAFTSSASEAFGWTGVEIVPATPTVVTPYILPPNLSHQRDPRRYSRAVTRSTQIYKYFNGGTVQSAPAKPVQRASSQRSRATVHTYQTLISSSPPVPVFGGTGMNWRVGQQYTRAKIYPNLAPLVYPFSGTVQPESTRQPRRTSSRAYIRFTPVVTQNFNGGQVQPRATVPVPRRTSARVVWRGSAIYSYFIGGQTQPLTTRQPRRTSARAWIRFVPLTTQNFNGGQVQPEATFPQQRRKTARAVTRSQGSTTNFNGGQVQPLPTRQPRRTSSRAYIRFTPVTTPDLYNGSVQPRATVPVPRRYPARIVWRAIYGQGYVFGTTQPLSTRQPRRTSARGIWRFVVGNAPFGPAGTIQPLTTRQPRRVTARVVWRSGQGVGQPGSYFVTGGTVHRRTPARVVFNQNTYVHFPPPVVRVFQRVPIPRRYPSRAYIRTTQTFLPFSTLFPQRVPIPRRYPTRAVTRSQGITTNLYYGSTQPRATVPVPRRTSARGVWHQQGTTVNLLNGLVQPKPTHPEARRKTARVVSRSLTGSLFVPSKGAVQPAATRQPRRKSARGVYRNVPVIYLAEISSTPVFIKWDVLAAVSSIPVLVQWNVGAPGPGGSQGLPVPNIIYNVDRDPHLSYENQIATLPVEIKMTTEIQISPMPVQRKMSIGNQTSMVPDQIQMSPPNVISTQPEETQTSYEQTTLAQDE